MTDRSRFAIGRQVAYIPKATDSPVSPNERWAAQIVAADQNGVTLLVRRPDGEPLIRQSQQPYDFVDTFGAAPNSQPPYALDWTLHFNERRQLTNLTLATPDVLSANACAFFGTINVVRDSTINFSHIHQIVDGNGGTTTFEVWRDRGGTFKRIVVISLAQGGGDFSKGVGFPIDDDSQYLLRGDYLYTQPTAVQTAGLGVMVDVHLQNR